MEPAGIREQRHRGHLRRPRLTAAPATPPDRRLGWADLSSRGPACRPCGRRPEPPGLRDVREDHAGPAGVPGRGPAPRSPSASPGRRSRPPGRAGRARPGRGRCPCTSSPRARPRSMKPGPDWRGAHLAPGCRAALAAGWPSGRSRRASRLCRIRAKPSRRSGSRWIRPALKPCGFRTGSENANAGCDVDPADRADHRLEEREPGDEDVVGLDADQVADRSRRSAAGRRSRARR